MSLQNDLENLVESTNLGINLNLFYNDVDIDWYTQTIFNNATIHMWEEVVKGDATDEQLEELARKYEQDIDTILPYLTKSLNEFRGNAYRTKYNELYKEAYCVKSWDQLVEIMNDANTPCSIEDTNLVDYADKHATKEDKQQFLEWVNMYIEDGKSWLDIMAESKPGDSFECAKDKTWEYFGEDYESGYDFAHFKPDGQGAEPTSRVLENRYMNEWVEYGTINGQNVAVYYMLTDNDGMNYIGEFDGSLVDWEEKIDRIVEVE